MNKLFLLLTCIIAPIRLHAAQMNVKMANTFQPRKTFIQKFGSGYEKCTYDPIGFYTGRIIATPNFAMKETVISVKGSCKFATNITFYRSGEGAEPLYKDLCCQFEKQEMQKSHCGKQDNQLLISNKM